MEPLASKLIMITGCNKGIGYGILKNLAARKESYRFIMAVRSAERAAQALAELEKIVPKVSARTTVKEVDIASSESIDKFVGWIKESGTKVDCLVNNAGMAFKGDAFNEEVVRVTFQTNYYGTFELTEKLLPYIASNGKIVTISSSMGKLSILTSEALRKEFDDPKITREKLNALAKRFHDDVVAGNYKEKGWPRQSYGVSKVCTNIYNRILARDEDVVKRGIQVYACCPGWVRTDMAGPKAPRSIEEGAVCPCDLVQLPWKVNPELQGKFFYDSKVTPI